MKLSDRVKNCLLVFVSVILVLAILEAALALFYPSKITRHAYQVEHGQYHPGIGWINKPGISGVVEGPEGISFHRRHNSHGLRGPREIGYDNPRGVKRVLLLGDSFIWGYGVNDEEVISEVLQRLVGERIEIINGAVTGYGTDQELLWLIEEGLKYRPDLVVLGYYVPNDADEIATSICYGYPKPIFALEEGRLALGNVPVPDTRETRRKGFDIPDTAFGRLKKFLRHNLHSYQFIVGRLNSVPALRKFFLSVGLGEEYTRVFPGVPYYTTPPDKAREVLDAIIRSLRDISGSEASADFLFMLIPGIEEDPDKPLGYRAQIDWEKQMRANEEASRYFAELTSRNSIHYLDLLPVVRERQRRGEPLYNAIRSDHHWNRNGHRIAAESIYAWLRDHGWPAGSGSERR